MSKKTERILSENVADRSIPKNNAKQQKQLLNTVKRAGGDIGMRVRASEKTKEDKMPNAIYMDNPWGSGRHIDTFEKFQVKDEEKLHEEAGLPTKRGAKQFKKFVKKAKKGKKDIGDKTQTKKLANQISIGTITDGTVISTYETYTSAFKDLNNPTRLEDFYMWLDRDKIDLNDDEWVRGTKEDFLRPMFKNLPNHKDRFPYDVLRDGRFIETKDGKIVAQINKLKGKVIVLDIIDENDEHQYVEYDLVKLIKRIKDKELKINSNETSKNIKINTPWGKINTKENQ